MHRFAFAVCLVMLLGGRVSSSMAAVDTAPPHSIATPSFDELLDRLTRIEQDNTRMRDELEQMRSRTGDDWLTETRAAEIRALVADVVTDAESRSSLSTDGLTAGWSEHFFLASPDGRFKLELAGVLQTRFVWNYHDSPDRFIYGFENTRTKLIASGHVFNPDLTFRIQTDLARRDSAGQSAGLEDAWIRYQLDNKFGVRVGQFKVPFNREELVRSWNQQAVERSLINESLNLGRTQGIELQYQGDAWQWEFAFMDAGTDNIAGGGFIGSAPVNTPFSATNLAEFATAIRLERLIAGRWEQFRDITSPPGEEYAMLWGGAVFYQQDEFGRGFSTARDEEVWGAITTDLSVEWGGANLFASFTYHYVDDPQSDIINIFAGVLQAGSYFSPRFEAFGRLEYAHFEFDAVPVPDLWLVTVGGNYYFDGQDVKFSMDFGFGLSEITAAWAADIAGYRPDSGGSEPQIVIRAQLQLLF